MANKSVYRENLLLKGDWFTNVAVVTLIWKGRGNNDTTYKCELSGNTSHEMAGVCTEVFYSRWKIWQRNPKTHCNSESCLSKQNVFRYGKVLLEPKSIVNSWQFLRKDGRLEMTEAWLYWRILRIPWRECKIRWSIKKHGIERIHMLRIRKERLNILGKSRRNMAWRIKPSHEILSRKKRRVIYQKLV